MATKSNGATPPVPGGDGAARGGTPHSRAATIRAAQEAARATREQVFPLPATGGEAVVRRLDLLELIALDAIPAALQGIVNELLETQIGGSGGEQPSATDVVRAAGGPLAALKQQQALADAACVAGFLDPRLVATAAEVTDPERELALDEIERSDRLAYWTWCQGGDAAALAPVFPEPAAAAAPRPPEPSLRREPVELPLRAAAAVRR